MEDQFEKIYKLKITIALEIHDRNEVFHVNASRQTYLPCILETMNEFLKNLDLEPLDLESVWVSYATIPLKWHYPLGLLFDMHVGQDRPFVWTLIVHSTNFPQEKLLRWDHPTAMEEMYMAMLKEADCIRNGSIKKIMNLSTADQTRLWKIVAENFPDPKFEEYQKIQQDLIAPADAEYRSVPVRFYLDNDVVVRKLITNFDTIASVLDQVGIANAKLLIHGIELHPETPIKWLYQHAAYADTFIHIVAKQIA